MEDKPKQYPCPNVQECEIPFVLTNLIVLYTRLHSPNFIAEPTRIHLREKYAHIKKVIESIMPPSCLDRKIVDEGISSPEDILKQNTIRGYMQGIETKLNRFHR
ncbi:MAG: hypothetical protein AABX17_00755 [Nanoarchaeota archaeon]